MLWLMFACAESDPGANLPESGFVVGTPGAIDTLSRCLRRFPKSDAAALGEAWAQSAAGCKATLYAEGSDAGLTCGPPPPALAAALAGHQLRFGLPRTPAGLLSGSVDAASSATLAATLLVPIPDAAGPLSLLIPAGEAAGLSMLSDEGAFLHVRGRPEAGIDIAAMVPEASQADRLFDLRSTLLSAAVLQGTWELAAYAPAPGNTMPEFVLGVGVRPASAPAAVAAFAEMLRKKWSVRREAIELETWHGECLRGLNIMPELEPCFLLRDDALAIGWNEAAVRTGAAAGARETFTTGLGAVIDTEALAASDHVLSMLVPPDVQLPPLEYPLGRLRLNAHREGRYVSVEVAAAGCP